MENKTTIKSFTDLNTWKEGHKLVLLIYKATKSFPKSEKFDLTSQIRRAVVSITSNVAEGFSRNSAKEKVQFYYTALGSLTEVQNQLLIAKDLEYIKGAVFKEIAAQTIIVSKLINGLIKSIKSQNA
jgi:four helix bundle protein